MRMDLTEIVLVVDRSGSMASCRAEAQAGIDHFIRSQKEQPGQARLTLCAFDDRYEFPYQGTLIHEVTGFTLQPRGSTALLDAVGKSINETGQRLAAMPEHERPGLVVFMIVTDGQENASHEFTKAQIRQMIEHQQQAYKWQFSYVGANHDAFADAVSMGVPTAHVASYTPTRSDKAYAAVASNVVRARYAAASGQSVNLHYTPDEQAQMNDPAKT